MAAGYQKYPARSFARRRRRIRLWWGMSGSAWAIDKPPRLNLTFPPIPNGGGIMASYPDRSDPQLTFIHPAHLHGSPLRLSGARSVLGRDPGCDIRIDDPYVSGRHATLSRSGANVVLEDLGSANGTLVNDRPVHSPRMLRDGDVLTFGSVSIRYEWHESTPERRAVVQGTVLMPAVNRAPRFDVGQQHGAHINNVGGHQYIDQRQESFLRQVAAARTRARRIVLFGFVLFLSGFAVFAYGVLRFMGRIGEPIPDDPNDWPEPGDMLGTDINGIPVFLLGWAAALVGMVLLVTGLVMHIIAASRQRSFDAASRRY
ncbi:FHA domain-containing protein [Streptomyces sp. NBC_00124]|uniref:FHA domain-containing protein n=1 Tax=Streptomyces sp. NBC_00124 TaxID=2975662 RepID=UPI002B1E7141|nr:FHA domain-containing protein [Streptomyces sp. NBC_00124]